MHLDNVTIERDIVNPIPEPAPALLFGIGALLVAGALGRDTLRAL